MWIDQDLCTGDGLCVDHCPDVFVQLEDGIAYVVQAGVTLNDPGSSGSLATVEAKNQVESMKQYLSWEIGLTEKVKNDETIKFYKF